MEERGNAGQLVRSGGWAALAGCGARPSGVAHLFGRALTRQLTEEHDWLDQLVAALFRGGKVELQLAPLLGRFTALTLGHVRFYHMQ